MALATACNIDLNKLTNMEVALDSNKQLNKLIDDTAKNYHTVDVSLAMTNLGNVGKILKVAYAGSKGFACSTSTIKILSKYQSMIKNSFITTSSFVGACLKALQLHKLALMAAEKGKLDTSVKMLQKCSELANAMATETGKLVQEAQDLCNLSVEALVTAQNDENLSKAEKERIERMITESKAKQAEMEIKTKDLHAQIEEARQQQAEIAKKADEERQRQFLLNVVASVVQPISKVAESAGKVLSRNGASDKNTENTEKPSDSILASLAKQEMQIADMKKDLQRGEREANAEIAKVGVLLMGLTMEKDDLQASIFSLELAIKALGKVKTTFEHTRQFWEGVEKHCKALIDINEFELMNDPDFKEEFIGALKQSGVSWLSLGKINYQAQLSIKEVDKDTDNIVSNLPTKLEALEIVKNDVGEIVKSLKNEVSVV